MWRTRFLAALVCLPGLAACQQAPTPEPKISLAEEAAPLSRLMPKLADATHMPLKASKAVETEVLCVYVQDVTPTDLLQKIAQATGGEWRKQPDGLYLVPKTPARLVLTQRGQAARAASIAKAIAKLDPSKQKPNAKPSQMAMMFGGTGDPIFYQFLATIGADTLATIEPSDRVVFSTRPTARQVGINADMSDAIAQYVERHNKSVNDQKAAEKAQGGGDDGDDGPDNFYPGMMGDRGLIKTAPYKANFVVTRGGLVAMLSGDGLTIQMVLYDAKGKQIGEDQTQIGQSFMGMSDEELEAATAVQTGQKPAPPTGPQEKPVEFSADTQRFVKGLMASFGGLGTGPDAAMSPVVRKQIHDQLLAPNVHDPLSYPGELLSGTAKAKNLNLVACLPDTFFSWFVSLFMTAATPTAVLKRLDNDVNLVVDHPDGWLVVSPSDFATESMNRDDLAKLCVAFDGKKDYSIDDLMSLAQLGFDGFTGSSSMQLWITFASPGLMMLSYTEDWDMLRLYAALSPVQRDELQKSHAIAVGALDEKAHALAERLVYGSAGGVMSFMGSQLMVDRPRQTDPLLGNVGGDVDDIMSEYGMDGVNPNDYRSEPTEVAPNGLPAQAMFTLNFTEQQVVRPAGKSTDQPNVMSMMAQAMPIDQLADTLASAEMMKGQAGSEYMQQMAQAYKSVQVGSQTHFHFRIYAGRDSFKAGQVVTSSFAGSDTYTLHNLPPDLQKKFDAAMERMKVMMKNMPTPPTPPPDSGGGATGPK